MEAKITITGTEKALNVWTMATAEVNGKKYRVQMVRFGRTEHLRHPQGAHQQALGARLGRHGGHQLRQRLGSASGNLRGQGAPRGDNQAVQLMKGASR